MKIYNAVISSADIGVDHDLLWCGIAFEYNGDSHNGTGQRIISRTEYIKCIMDVVGVDNWNKLKGKNIRVLIEKKNMENVCVAIGHIIKNKWFYHTCTPYKIKKQKNG